MRGGDGDEVAEAEAVEVVELPVVHRHVELVDRDGDAPLPIPGLELLAEALRDLHVGGGEALAAVDHEDDVLGGGHRDLDLAGDRLGEAFLVLEADAAGVDQLERLPVVADHGGDAVARHAGLVVDQGNLLAGKAVEEGRLPHVGAADDGDSSHDVS